MDLSLEIIGNHEDLALKNLITSLNTQEHVKCQIQERNELRSKFNHQLDLEVNTVECIIGVTSGIVSNILTGIVKILIKSIRNGVNVNRIKIDNIEEIDLIGLPEEKKIDLIETNILKK